MKLKYLVSIIALTSVSAFGASVTVTNNAGPVNTQSVVDNSGAAVDGGFAAIGSISDVSALNTLTSAGLDALFTVYDGATGAVNNAPFNGTYSISNNGSDITGTAWAGAPIYLVLGNGGDLASSTQGAVLRVGNFPGSEPAVQTVNVNNTAEVLLGSFDTFTLQPGPIPTQNAALALAPFVPEPSSSLLIGLAGLSLLIRRRR
ncbi:MAG: PEP-CTERM sorting domain-containing protein [Verrucomicrobiota bacterium]|nr:PEP-CTERM sorting domain-containing protein [Verrucomicrobiota bacterium]MEE2734220.1 PEP-CTERM sorting domain-containing protein [Verrucomicrobiota bacterium]